MANGPESKVEVVMVVRSTAVSQTRGTRLSRILERLVVISNHWMTRKHAYGIKTRGSEFKILVQKRYRALNIFLGVMSHCESQTSNCTITVFNYPFSVSTFPIWDGAGVLTCKDFLLSSCTSMGCVVICISSLFRRERTDTKVGVVIVTEH